MRIHREGKEIVTWTAIILIALSMIIFNFLPDHELIKLCLLLASLIIFILILQFFRYPKRSITYNEKYIIAPADGKIVVIEQTEEKEFYKDQRMQISIFMSPLNVHANWYPMSGRIRYLRYHEGKYLVAWHPKASTENERSTIVIEKDSNKTILVRQIAGAVAKRIVYYPHEGDIIRQGAELGFIKFGSRVDIFLPLNAKIMANIDQKTKGGVTVLAELM